MQFIELNTTELKNIEGGGNAWTWLVKNAKAAGAAAAVATIGAAHAAGEAVGEYLYNIGVEV